MKRALQLAEMGAGYTSPNPLVGAVIVKNGKIIGEGYHKVYGSHHAEVAAFQNAVEDVTGATLYVTLEPCSHYGKTPPCAKAIIAHGIQKVVVGLLDPNPLVAGKGIQMLKEAGIEVRIGVLEKECKKINEIFLKYITTKEPFCIMKTAMTLDGKIAAYTGDSRYITGEAARAYVHQIRHRVAAIMVGVDTVLIDDPMLNTRLPNQEASDPIRIIVDSRGRIPLEAKVFHVPSTAKTIIATTALCDPSKRKDMEEMGAEVILTPSKDQRVDLCYLMKKLGEKKIDSILLEGGSTLNFSALQEGIVDQVISFIAPKILGGENAKSPVGGIGIAKVDQAIKLIDIDIVKIGEDMMITGYVQKEVHPLCLQV